jgi:nitrate reductase NapE component
MVAASTHGANLGAVVFRPRFVASVLVPPLRPAYVKAPLATAPAPKGVESMRVTSLVLAIVGGVVGIMFGLLAMAVGGVSDELEEGSGTTVIWLGVSAIAASVLGIVAGGLHFGGKRRTLMSFVLLVAGVWHLVSISYFGIFGFLLLLLAAIFAWLSRKPSADEGQPGELVAAEAAGAPSADPSEDFRRLAQMKEEGLITAEEYDEKRRRLLERL